MERGAKEIKQLGEFFLNSYTEKYKGKKLKLEKEAWDVLLSHSFPGNIRELEQVINYLYVFNEGEKIKPEDLPEIMRTDEHGRNGFDLEMMTIKHALKAFNYFDRNYTLAFKALGITRNTLKKYLEKAVELGYIKELKGQD
jgi:transcriptional regulator with PAS, ATPase and Fis domain